MAGFYGTFSFTRDDKGRIQIPSQFRRFMTELDPKILVMTYGPDHLYRCIYAFPMPAWDYYMDQMLTLDVPDADRLDLMREILGPATNCSMDGQYRVKIPEELADYAKLDREIEIVGFMDRIEIWNPEVRREYQSQTKFDYSKIAKQLFIGKMPKPAVGNSASE